MDAWEAGLSGGASRPERELDLVLEAVRKTSGIELRDYARTTLRRRIDEVVRSEHVANRAQLGELAARDPAVAARIVAALCVNVTGMFRDSDFFQAFRKKAVPRLGAEGPIRAWHAGCATGEEVWSHAIVLQEEGLGGIARFYGTDLSAGSLLRAQRGLLPLERMREYTWSHYRAGGRGDFSEYYATDGAAAVVRTFLRRRAAFGRHDLVAGGRLGTFDVVFCRNVLIYFDAPLQERVHALLYDSLRPGGILALGHGEALTRSMQDAYETLDEQTKLFVRR
jgi:chemotaxis protein methyltransferase CheR